MAEVKRPGWIDPETVIKDDSVVCPDCGGQTVMTGVSTEKSMGSWEVVVDVVCPKDGTAFGIKMEAQGSYVGLEVERA